MEIKEIMIGIHENEALRALNNDYTLNTKNSDSGTPILTIGYYVTS